MEYRAVNYFRYFLLLATATVSTVVTTKKPP